MSRISDWTRALPIGLVAAVLLGGVVVADSPRPWYEIEALPPLGGTERCPAHTNAVGVNELGHAVGLAELASDILDPWGNWVDCRFENHAVIWRDGEIVDLGFLTEGMPYANGKGINDHDQVVGESMGPIPPFSGGFGMPMLWTEGVGMINPAAGKEWPIGWAWGINNAGQVAMTSQDAYFWDPVEGRRRIHFPDDPGERSGSDAWEINNNGLVVGEAPRASDPFGFFHAYKYDSERDTITDLHDEYYRHSGAYGLNDLGDVGGWIEAYTNHQFAQLWKDDGEAILLPLDDPEFAYAQIEHINNHGLMVGRDLGLIIPRRLVGWIGFEAPDRAPEIEPVGEGGEDAEKIMINPAPGTGERSIRKIALYDLLSEEDSAAWDRMMPFEINDAGQIVGIGTRDGGTFGFLMTPRVPIEIVFEEAPEIVPAPAAPVTEAVPRSATANIPEVEAVMSTMRGPDGSYSVGRFDPLQVRHGRKATGPLDVNAVDPVGTSDLRMHRNTCEAEDERCVWRPDVPETPGEGEEEPGSGTSRLAPEGTVRDTERDRLESK